MRGDCWAKPGFPVTKNADGTFQCEKFPVGEVSFNYATHSSNKALAEFMQAQWKQNLGITVMLRNSDFRTFNQARSKLEYKGFALMIWGADYMDPATFLNIFLTQERRQRQRLVGQEIRRFD